MSNPVHYNSEVLSFAIPCFLGLAFSSPFLFLLKRFTAPPVEPGVYFDYQKDRNRAELISLRGFYLSIGRFFECVLMLPLIYQGFQSFKYKRIRTQSCTPCKPVLKEIISFKSKTPAIPYFAGVFCILTSAEIKLLLYYNYIMISILRFCTYHFRRCRFDYCHQHITAFFDQ